MKHSCINCNSELSTQKKYCSNACQVKFQRKQKVLNGTAYYTTIKNYLLDTRGNQCEICSNTMWNRQPIDLVFDHIDGNSSNNSLDNVRLICNNCDAQLPTFKARNTGNGRYSRRVRYIENKSY